MSALSSVHASKGPARMAMHAWGIALSAVVAVLSIHLAGQPWIEGTGLSALTLAIVLGMLIGNTVYGRVAHLCGPGVGFSKQTLLRLGIVLYGFRLTMQDVAHVGWAGVVIDALIVTLTFTLAVWIGVRWLGVDRKTAMLIGAGSAICGAAAVLAAEPVVKARAEQVTVAVATVVVFGTVATFLYPALYTLGASWPLIPQGEGGFGVYIGSTVHEVAQVVAAGNAISDKAADTAVIAKMVRVMMLAPFLIGLSLWLRKSSREAGAQTASGAMLPWFAIGFVLIVLFNSLGLQPVSVNRVILEGDNFLLAMAMASLGLTTQVSAIRRAGAKPLFLASLLFIWLVLGGAVLNRLIAAGLA